MKCPGCKTEMAPMTLEARMGGQVAIDVCTGCQAFWFDHFESLKLSPGSTLKLMKFIGEHQSPAKPSLPATMQMSGVRNDAAAGARPAGKHAVHVLAMRDR